MAKRTHRFQVNPAEILRMLVDGELKNSRDVSWHILSTGTVCDEGDDAQSNFGLRIFEDALDWTIGIRVLNFLQAFAERKARPKPFILEITSRSMTAVFPSGSRYMLGVA